MAESGGQSDEDLRKAASDSIRHGEEVRERVRELVLNALTSRRFDREAIRETVRTVTEGVSLGAEGSRAGGTRHAVAEAFRGMDQALAKSVEAGQEAIRRILDTGRDVSEHELQQALAGLQKVEEDFVATVSQVAETAGERVAPELREVVGKATRAGTDTGRQVAAAMTELTRTLAGTSLKVTLAGIEVAGEFGVRFAQIAGGVLSGMAAALDKSSADTKKNP
jgi:hypothetical protein